MLMLHTWNTTKQSRISNTISWLYNFFIQIIVRQINMHAPDVGTDACLRGDEGGVKFSPGGAEVVSVCAWGII